MESNQRRGHEMKKILVAIMLVLVLSLSGCNNYENGTYDWETTITTEDRYQALEARIEVLEEEPYYLLQQEIEDNTLRSEREEFIEALISDIDEYEDILEIFESLHDMLVWLERWSNYVRDNEWVEFTDWYYEEADNEC